MTDYMKYKDQVQTNFSFFISKMKNASNDLFDCDYLTVIYPSGLLAIL